MAAVCATNTCTSTYITLRPHEDQLAAGFVTSGVGLAGAELAGETGAGVVVATTGGVTTGMTWNRLALRQAASSGSVSDSCSFTSESSTLTARRIRVASFCVAAVAATRLLPTSFRSPRDAEIAFTRRLQLREEIRRQAGVGEDRDVRRRGLRHCRGLLEQHLR